MTTRRIAVGLGAGAGALLGAALLSGLTSPSAAADVFGFELVPTADLADFGTTQGLGMNPVIDYTFPAFGGLGTDQVTTEYLANFDLSGTNPVIEVPAFISGGNIIPNPNAGLETLNVNDYSTPLFTDVSTDVAHVSAGADVTDAPVVNTTTDTLLLGPASLQESGLDFGVFTESIPSATLGGAPTVTTDLITPLGEFPLGGDLGSMLGGSGFDSLLGGSALDSLLGGGSTAADSAITPMLDLFTGIL